MLAFVASADADDRPSWAIIEAADRLIAKNALFMPGGDGFLKQPSGLLIQYERPSKSYSRDGKNWMIEILSPRWRSEAAKEWQPWNDARPRHNHWLIGTIRVDVLTSGVQASWVDNTNFSRRTPPTQAQVMQRLNTLGQASARTPDNPLSRAVQGPTAETRPHVVRSEPSSQGGIFRALPNGALQKISPPQIPQIRNPNSMPSTPSPRPRVAHSLPLSPPPSSSPPQDQITPAPTPPLSSNIAELSLLERNFRWIIPSIALALATFIGLGFWLLRMRSKTKIPSYAHSSPASPRLVHPSTFPVQNNPTQTTFQPNHLMSPAESSFLNALQQAVDPSWTIAAKIRAANLFGDVPTPDPKTSHASVCDTLIDFVIYNPSGSRILCAIELDENSRSRPDRVKRDSFLTDLFKSKQVPLLRIPISWTYYPQGLRAELLKAGVSLANVA
jgi:hypothetical protein